MSHKDISNKISKHIVCKNILKYNSCTRGDKCLFAHTIDELVDIDCKFNANNKCSKGVYCRFKHNNETRESYHKRVGISFEKNKDRKTDITTKIDDKKDDITDMSANNLYNLLINHDSDEEN